jgi:hypothetical protein
MTEPDAKATPSDLAPELPIEFMGREMWVRMPTPEQLLVWKRTLVQLQRADTDGWNFEQVMAALERTRKIMDSVLVHRTDVEWLDDQMLDGTVDLKGTAQIIQKTVEAFAEAVQAEGNRETRRAVAAKKPGKKAARKAPMKKVST